MVGRHGTLGAPTQSENHRTRPGQTGRPENFSWERSGGGETQAAIGTQRDAVDSETLR